MNGRIAAIILGVVFVAILVLGILSGCAATGPHSKNGGHDPSVGERFVCYSTTSDG